MHCLVGILLPDAVVVDDSEVVSGIVVSEKIRLLEVLYGRSDVGRLNQIEMKVAKSIESSDNTLDIEYRHRQDIVASVCTTNLFCGDFQMFEGSFIVLLRSLALQSQQYSDLH